MKRLIITSALVLACAAPAVPAYADAGGGSVPSKSTSGAPSKSPARGGPIVVLPKSTSIAGELNSGIQGVAAQAFIGIKNRVITIGGWAGEDYPDDFILWGMAKEYVCGVKRHFGAVSKDSRCGW